MPRASGVMDLGCGVGYGAAYMAARAHQVVAVDNSPDAIAYGQAHFPGPYYVKARAEELADATPPDQCDYVTAFEILEHLEDPGAVLAALPATVKELFCSVPNEAYFPHKGPGHENGYLFHHRHYHEHEFRALLWESGWAVETMRHQTGPFAAIGSVPGRTLVARCVRRETLGQRGKRVAILALGPSLHMYTHVAKAVGGRHVRWDEVWAVNALGDVMNCDRLFHMDDVRIQEKRAENLPDSNIAAMHKWLKDFDGPVYTSHVEPGYSNLIRYPIEAVVHDLGVAYFNSTVAYAIALAIHERCQSITLFGCDFTYPNAHHAERGRACVEFWVAMARSRGIVVTFPPTTSLMDACEGPDAAYYGFRDGYEITIEPTNHLRFTPRAELPTAEEIEARYDHDVHPNANMAGQPASIVTTPK